MRKLLLSIGTVAIICACGTTKTTTTKAPVVKIKHEASYFSKSITADELKEALYIYASDDFQGRETGTPGQKKAVEYLKDYYISIGIPSARPDGNYFQNVPLQKQEVPDMTLKIGDNDFKMIDDYVSVADGEDAAVSSEQIAFVGYGIESDKYSSYTDVDVTGKFVLMKAGEPKNADGNFVVSGSDQASLWSTNQQYVVKSQIALSKGAKGILFYAPQIYQFVALQYGKGGQISLKGDSPTEKQYYLFVNSSIAKGLVEDIDTNNTSKLIDTSINFTFKSNTKE
ncbi:MAG: peptidase, partial [Flavobacteriaceae bacterium]|nr:peptidase [Flavobacteriaceae bacterium]